MSVDDYKILAEPGIAQTRVLGSRFLGSALPAASADQALTFLEDERKRRHDATHWCWAYRLGVGEDRTERSADAGEPHGTAGLPILREIQKRELTNCLVIVTRYFGGTKLGTGGLVRAYGDCAGLALDAAPVRVCTVRAELWVECPFDDQGTVYALTHRFQATVEPIPDPARAVMRLYCRPDVRHPLAEALREAGHGRIIVR
jgi:uncharacterized YigZ family protein